MQALAERIRETALKMTEIALSHGLARPCNAHVSSLAVIGSAEALALAVLKADYPIHPPQAVQELVTMVLDGLGAKDR